MSTQMSDDEIRKMARGRVAAKKGFFIHLITYIIVNALLVSIWAISGGGYMWFLWAAAGWGVGIIFHCFGVFVFSGEGSEWEQNEIRKEMDKIKRNQG
jgi:hypothetical protein